jgi:hypothetical protein
MPKIWRRVLSSSFSGLERSRKLVRTAEAALIVTCVIGALSVTGDMMLVTIMLVAGIVFGTIAIVTEATLSRRNKLVGCFAFLLVMAGVGSSIFYGYHTDRKEVQQERHQQEASIQGVKPDVPPLYNGPFQSTYERMIFVCPVPAPDPFEAGGYSRKKEILKSAYAAWGGTIGIDFSMTEIRSGLKVTMEPKTFEAKKKIFQMTGTTVSKVEMEVRRIGPDWETITWMIEWGNLKPLVQLLQIPEDEKTVLQNRTEMQVYGTQNGKCKII